MASLHSGEDITNFPAYLYTLDTRDQQSAVLLQYQTGECLCVMMDVVLVNKSYSDKSRINWSYSWDKENLQNNTVALITMEYHAAPAQEKIPTPHASPTSGI